MEAMGAGAEAGQFSWGCRPLAAGLGKQGVGKVQRRVRRAAYQAFMAVDAALGQVDDGLEAGLQEAFAQDAGQTGVTRPHCRNGMGSAGRNRPGQSVKSSSPVRQIRSVTRLSIVTIKYVGLVARLPYSSFFLRWRNSGMARRGGRAAAAGSLYNAAMTSPRFPNRCAAWCWRPTMPASCVSFRLVRPAGGAGAPGRAGRARAEEPHVTFIENALAKAATPAA